MKNFEGKNYKDKEKLVHSLQQQVKLVFNLITICKYVSLEINKKMLYTVFKY